MITHIKAISDAERALLSATQRQVHDAQQAHKLAIAMLDPRLLDPSSGVRIDGNAIVQEVPDGEPGGE